MRARKWVFVAFAVVLACMAMGLVLVGFPTYSPSVTLEKVSHRHAKEERSAMRLIKDFAAESKGGERLFADVRVQVPEKSGGTLTNGGYPFVLLDEKRKRVGQGRRELPLFPMEVGSLIFTTSNLQIPVRTEVKYLQITVGFQPPSVRTRAALFLRKVGLRNRVPAVCDFVFRMLPNERRWREKVYEVVVPATERLKPVRPAEL